VGKKSGHGTRELELGEKRDITKRIGGHQLDQGGSQGWGGEENFVLTKSGRGAEENDVKSGAVTNLRAHEGSMVQIPKKEKRSGLRHALVSRRKEK